jgi:hypothetical protein
MRDAARTVVLSAFLVLAACGDDDADAMPDAGGACVMYPQCIASTRVCCEQDLPVCFLADECAACCGAPCVADRSECP